VTGYGRREIMLALKNMGLTSIVLHEETLRSLQAEGKVTLIKGSSLLNDNRILPRANNLLYSRIPRNYTISAQFCYLVVDDSLIFDLVKTILELKLGSKRVKDLGWETLEVAAKEEDVLDIPLDINVDKAIAINEVGYAVIPAFQNHPEFGDEQYSYKISRLSDFGNQIILLLGDEAIGQPEMSKLVQMRFKEVHKLIGFEELTSLPRGIRQVITPTQILRFHHLDVLTGSEAVSVKRAIRAVVERNNRVIVIEPYTGLGVPNLFQFNAGVIAKIKKGLLSRGFRVEPIEKSPYRDFTGSIFSFLSIASAWILGWIFMRVFIRSLGVSSLLWSGVGVATLFICGSVVGRLWQVMSLAALTIAVCAPVLIWIYLEEYINEPHVKRDFKYLYRGIGRVFFFSICAGILIHNLLFTSTYFWGLTVFSGVKLAMTLPFFILVAYAYIKPGRLRYTAFIIMRALSHPITIRVLIGGLLVLGAGVFYVMRTGNGGLIAVGQSEIAFRSGLESLFMIRPRTKEIVIAYPLLVLFLMYGYRVGLSMNQKKGLWILSALVSVSVINTFCHIHSEPLISLYRSFIGLGIGTLLGILIMVGIDFFVARRRAKSGPPPYV
ncbi:MAG: DUF5693 family protein, partial [Candidatus Margulisiibacteriota bacterium]